MNKCRSDGNFGLCGSVFTKNMAWGKCVAIFCFRRPGFLHIVTGAGGNNLYDPQSNKDAEK